MQTTQIEYYTEQIDRQIGYLLSDLKLATETHSIKISQMHLDCAREHLQQVKDYSDLLAGEIPKNSLQLTPAHGTLSRTRRWHPATGVPPPSPDEMGG